MTADVTVSCWLASGQGVTHIFLLLSSGESVGQSCLLGGGEMCILPHLEASLSVVAAVSWAVE